MIVNNDRIKNIRNIPFLFAPQLYEPYRPLRYFSFAIDRFFFGLKPSFYHLSNTIFHLINVFLVFKIFFLLFKNKELAFFSALIFGVNPAWNETIVWIKNRSGLLACLFLLLAFYFFIKRKDTITAVSFLFALLAKEISLAFPLIITLYVFLFEEKGKKELKRTIPYWIISFFWVIFLFIIYKGGGVERLPPGAGIFFSLKILFKFFLILIFPFFLNAEREVSFPESVFDTEVIVAFLALILVGFILSKTKRKEVIFAVLWIILNLILTANPAIVPGRPLAEHRLYIPGIGFSLLLCLLLQKKKAFIYILVPLFFVTSFRRNFIWKDSHTFWKETVKTAPHSSRAWTNLGLVEINKENTEKAEEYLRKALEIDTRFSVNALNGLLGILIDTGRLDEAEKRALNFIKLRPDEFDIYSKLIDIYIQKKEIEKAKEVCEGVLAIMFELEQGRAKDCVTLGASAFQLGMVNQAENLYKKAIDLEPLNATAYNNLGIIYRAKGDFEKVVTFYQRAVKIDPRNALLHYNLGNVYDDIGKQKQAISHLYKAAKYDPSNSDAWYNLGLILNKERDYKEAANCFKKVMELEPENQEVKRKYEKAKNRISLR